MTEKIQSVIGSFLHFRQRATEVKLAKMVKTIHTSFTYSKDMEGGFTTVEPLPCNDSAKFVLY